MAKPVEGFAAPRQETARHRLAARDVLNIALPAEPIGRLVAEGVIAEIHAGVVPLLEIGDLLRPIDLVQLALVDEADRGQAMPPEATQQHLVERLD